MDQSAKYFSYFLNPSIKWGFEIDIDSWTQETPLDLEWENYLKDYNVFLHRFKKKVISYTNLADDFKDGTVH